MADFPAVVFDNGTGFSKMGYAGNAEPHFVIPSVVAMDSALSGNSSKGKNSSGKLSSKFNQAKTSGSTLDDLGILIGDEALLSASKSCSLVYPIQHGQIENWDLMESFWLQSMYRYLQCEPENHLFLLTEPPLNAPENRESTAEIMFETFNVPGLYIAVQAVLALAASWTGSKNIVHSPLTGTVVDSGDGVTHIIPVIDGYAIGSAIKHIPLAGRDISHFVQQLLRERIDISVPPSQSLEIARTIKEQHGYVCQDLAKEFLQLSSSSNAEIVKMFEWKDPKSSAVINFELGHERFLAPEIFFSPDFCSDKFPAPLPALIDNVIQSCPIDCRRSLYQNIVLSGGSTLFKGFSKRLQKDINALVSDRLSYAHNLDVINKSSHPFVNVMAHKHQRYAVWSGGSLLASMEQFSTFCHSKADYEEFGPSIVRQSRVFQSIFS